MNAEQANAMQMHRMIRDELIRSKKAFWVKCRTMMPGEMDQGKLILAVMVAKTDGEPTAVQKASQDQACQAKQGGDFLITTSRLTAALMTTTSTRTTTTASRF